MDPFLGEIRIFGFNFAPTYWALCNGATLPTAQYTALSSLLGTRFGGNGTTTFGLPDLAGRAMGGAGNGVGLTSRAVGDVYGAAAVTLTTAQMPAHSHTLHALIGRTVQRSGTPAAGNGLGAYVGPTPYAQATSDVTMDTRALTTAGSGTAHDNNQPMLAMTPCIAMQGVSPSFT